MRARKGPWLSLLPAAALCFGALSSAAFARSEDVAIGERAHSLLGGYLAARFAKGQHDTDVAAEFYRSALAKAPDDDLLIEQSFMMEATEGEWARAGALAERLAGKQPTHRMAHTFLGLRAFKEGDLAKAEKLFAASGSSPIGELTGAIARAWVAFAQGKHDTALSLLDAPKQAEWAQFYLRYHKALVADLAGRTSEARSSYERVFRQDSRTLRTTLAFARHAAHAGDFKQARTVLKEHIDKNQSEAHPLARALLAQVQNGRKVELSVKQPVDGLSEIFYQLGEALTSEGGISVGMLYLQMALYLKPDQPFALAALANALETTKRFEEASTVYDRIPPGSPLQASIEIRKAFNLNSLDRTDEAIALLEKVVKQEPGNIKPRDALGSILRSKKRYAEAAEHYTKAISLVSKPERRHWIYYYSRGTCYERMKRWPQAEADLQKALQLSPDQPLALNYLGYSWIDQNRNLKQAMTLIEKAVSLKPEDGYIVDSLGWAHFRQGNYKEAVRYLERAVELKPEDPVLNDHLGDALWRVGREREARFQWDLALSLKPEPEEIDKIKHKLASGLPGKAQANVDKKLKDSSRHDRHRKRESKLSPKPPVLQ